MSDTSCSIDNTDNVINNRNSLEKPYNIRNKQLQSYCDGTSDSDECLSEPLRYRNFQYSTSSAHSSSTILAHSSIAEENDNFINCNGSINFTNIQIPIVGYEIMEERAKFTVYKLRIENKDSGDCWFVFRRYTDFVRLCNRIQHLDIVRLLPQKRWLKNNFDPNFLEERVNGLQTLVNAILADSDLMELPEIQDFFCLNEPPNYADTNEESRVLFESLEETISDLRLQLREKETLIDSLQDSLHSKALENDNLKKLIEKCTENCDNCQVHCKKYSNLIKMT